jgi:hypothetical protein
MRVGYLMALVFMCAATAVEAQTAYTPPPASAATVAGVPFSQGKATGKTFRERFDTCDAHDTCLGKALRCSNDKNRDVALMQLPGNVLFFEAKMGVDTDGSALAAKIYEARKKAGKKTIDQPDTSLRYDDNSSVDADRVPYIAVPGGSFRSEIKIDKGDVVAVVHADKIAYALIADIGPVCRIGEGSIKLHEDLGHKACTTRDEHGVCAAIHDVSIESGVLYFVFAGSRTQILPGLSPEDINDRVNTVGASLMQKLKGQAKTE